VTSRVILSRESGSAFPLLDNAERPFVTQRSPVHMFTLTIGQTLRMFPASQIVSISRVNQMRLSRGVSLIKIHGSRVMTYNHSDFGPMIRAGLTGQICSAKFAMLKRHNTLSFSKG
jgi:hypothetical protein